MKKIIFIAVILLVAAFGIGAGSGLGNQIKDTTTKNVQNVKQVLPAKDSLQQTSTAVPEPDIAEPQTISIPKIGVNAAVESVGMDAKGSMDVPQDSDNVAWYNLGAKPGQKGNAVIAAHYDKVDGSPAVFYDIAKLTIGDEIMVTDVNGTTRKFVITRTDKFPYDNFPMQEVFGDSSETMLNLITCEGNWNSSTGMYSHRSVVFSRLVQE